MCEKGKKHTTGKRMMNNLKIFKNKEFGNLRTVEIEGAPWFVGKDVASILGYANTRKALIDHIDEEDKDDVTIRDAIGRNQTMTAINESGLYSWKMERFRRSASCTAAREKTTDIA